MLAKILALVVAAGSFGLYGAAFFFPQVHRKPDMYWSGVGLFYALILWFCAGRMTGAVLLGQMAAIALLGWFGWQIVTLRMQLAGTAPLEPTAKPVSSSESTPAAMPTPTSETTEVLPEGTATPDTAIASEGDRPESEDTEESATPEMGKPRNRTGAEVLQGVVGGIRSFLKLDREKAPQSPQMSSESDVESIGDREPEPWDDEETEAPPISQPGTTSSEVSEKATPAEVAPDTSSDTPASPTADSAPEAKAAEPEAVADTSPATPSPDPGEVTESSAESPSSESQSEPTTPDASTSQDSTDPNP